MKNLLICLLAAFSTMFLMGCEKETFEELEIVEQDSSEMPKEQAAETMAIFFP